MNILASAGLIDEFNHSPWYVHLLAAALFAVIAFVLDLINKKNGDKLFFIDFAAVICAMTALMLLWGAIEGS